MSKKNKLVIKWQRLLMGGETCPRCGTTETEAEKAAGLLTQILSPLGIEVVLEKKELSFEEFKTNTLQSNLIWLNNRTLEDWLGATTGQSECCDVCGPNDCRTIDVGQDVYESIPAELIVKAGLLAAAQLLGPETCDCFPAVVWPKGGCCSS